jgi:hypothetical protein
MDWLMLISKKRARKTESLKIHLDGNEYIKVTTLNVNQIRYQAETIHENLPGIRITAFLISFFPTAISLHGNIRIPGFIYCPGLVSPQTSTQDAITVPLTAM